MDEIKFIGNNHPEDVKWLSSLSESEIDMLISLKKIALQRAKAVGHESLAQKFDLKMLRALGYILMQHIKGEVNGLQLTGLTGLADLVNGSNLLKLDLEDRVETESNLTQENKQKQEVKLRQGQGRWNLS